MQGEKETSQAEIGRTTVGINGMMMRVDFSVCLRALNQVICFNHVVVRESYGTLYRRTFVGGRAEQECV